ncbi:tenascin-like [Micropterus salmoides]|uniref:tenascin-like n=1 Tax=Micropterus salmoides TaxID=27706 RepID=UPI0018ECE7CD|nr:tenascin-like [Micropterus salmoides]
MQWKKVNDILNYILEFNGGEINVAASEGQEHVTHTISLVTSGTKYDFSLFAVFENVRSRGVHITAVTAPRNTEEFKSVGQNENSVTLQWRKVNDILNYVILFSGSEINVAASEGQEHVTHTISELTSGTKYDFSLFTVFENVRSRGVHITAVTAPRNTEEFKSVGQNENSVTLQWRKVNHILNYVILFSGSEINVAASEGREHVTHTISELTSATKYDFSLFTVFENVRSRGVNIAAVTAPSNPEKFKPVGKNETSITLQWNKVNNILNYILEFNGRMINVAASEGREHVTHTISELTSGTKYDFSLFTVFENVRSSGVSITGKIFFLIQSK